MDQHDTFVLVCGAASIASMQSGGGTLAASCRGQADAQLERLAGKRRTHNGHHTAIRRPFTREHHHISRDLCQRRRLRNIVTRVHNPGKHNRPVCWPRSPSDAFHEMMRARSHPSTTRPRRSLPQSKISIPPARPSQTKTSIAHPFFSHNPGHLLSV